MSFSVTGTLQREHMQYIQQHSTMAAELSASSANSVRPISVVPSIANKISSEMHTCKYSPKMLPQDKNHLMHIKRTRWLHQLDTGAATLVRNPWGRKYSNSEVRRNDSGIRTPGPLMSTG